MLLSMVDTLVNSALTSALPLGRKGQTIATGKAVMRSGVALTGLHNTRPPVNVITTPAKTAA
jgi:hypothetical protein